MDAVKGEIRGLEEARKLVRNISARLANPRPAMEAIGNSLLTSIKRNFEEGGRPAWPALKASTLARKKTKKILIETRDLMESVNQEVSSDGRRLVIGTNLVYAAAHQFGFKGQIEQHISAHRRKVKSRDVFQLGPRGGKKKLASGVTFVKAHDRTIHQNIPARPFIAIQSPEDIDEIKAILTDFLTK